MYATTPRSATPTPSFVSAIDGFRLDAVVAMAARWANRQFCRRRTARILQGLDDNALKDIGLQRGAIDAAFHDERYRAL